MATAISKPAASQPPKMKRPPPSFTQTSSVFNGIKQSPSTSSSPALASKRLPGANPPSANGIATPTINGALNRPVNRPRKDNQKPVDISTSRPQRATTRASAAEVDRRVTKSPREPLIKTTPYILKKYSKSPPSLILHLHPTHFRFDQQDGSFPYNSEMKVIIEHIREQTIPHDMLEELLRAGVKFYEGCLIVKVVDHKSASTQTNKTTVTSTDEKNTPFSIHNYNQHVTPSPYVPYPKQNQIKSEVNDLSKSDTPEKKPDEESADSAANGKPATENGTAGTANDSEKQSVHKPKVFTTVLYPTPLSFQAELTYLSTTPHPHANSSSVVNKKQPTATQPQSKNSAGQPPSKRQKMLVDPEDLPKFEAALIRAVAPPVYLDPVDNFESAQELLKLMESPLHCARPPSPKRRKRTIAELAADEALAAEEERFMLIMDERLEPATSGAAAGAKIAVDDTAGAVPFEPRFSRFKTIENIRMQHEEKAKREHEKKLQQEQAKRQQQQEQDRERRRIMEQRQAQAEELAKEERRQQLAAQQAQLAAQQQQRLANGLAQVSQGQMSSPVVRNQTPHATSSPVVGNGIGTQGGVSMSMTASTQGAGSPPRPPSTMQHTHPGLMGHPMAPSRSQQNHSRNGTPQLTQGTPAMSHATPIMRNVTPTQRMAHGSPPNTTLTQTPVMGNAIMSTPQIGAGLGLTPQQQQQIMLQQRQQQILAAQQSGLTPQQFAHLQAQQNIQNHQHQQQLLNQQQQVQQNQMPQQHQLQQMQSHQAYQAQLIRNQMAQMQMAQHKQNQQQQGGMQMTPQQQQQQMLMAAAQANANQGQIPQTAQSARYQQMFKQRLQLLRADMQKRLQQQYGTPQQYPPPIAQQYYTGLETTARAWIQDIIRRETMQAQQRQQAAILQQQHQQQMMANGMGK